ncbi:TonB-dependent receptor [Acetobacter orientalis]|uniref:TonB-dependent receptor n=1 Tax=Acetobacter orientalis TaxID=146474 RepID=UPI0039EBC575
MSAPSHLLSRWKRTRKMSGRLMLEGSSGLQGAVALWPRFGGLRPPAVAGALSMLACVAGYGGAQAATPSAEKRQTAKAAHTAPHTAAPAKAAPAGTQAAPAAVHATRSTSKAHKAAAAKEASGAMEAVTVTSTRRATSIMRVPVSVAAYNQAYLDMKGAKTIQDVLRFTPGLTFDPTSKTPIVRGLASGAGSATTGIYLDDTPIQIRNLGFNAENSVPQLFDMERVEVLRGPQGTLFGAGAEGGAVRYITPAPNLRKYTSYARADVSASQYGAPTYDLGVALGGPIIKDKLAFRASAERQSEGGYIDHLDYRTGQKVDKNTNNNDVNVFRGSILVKPMDNLTITPSILYQQRLTGDTDTYFAGLSNPSKQQFYTNSPEYQKSSDRFFLPSLNVKYDIGNVSLISNTAYLHRNNVTGYNGTIYDLSYYNEFLDSSSPYYPLLTPQGINPKLPYYYGPSTILNQQRNFTEEFRVQSRSPLFNRLMWVAGVYYQNDKQMSSERLEDPQSNEFTQLLFNQSAADFWGGWPDVGKYAYINQTRAKDEQTAVFANATVEIIKGLKFDAGIRYTHADYSFTNFADGSHNDARTTGAGGISENPVTPKFTLSYQIDRHSMVYAGWSKGWRVGGANTPVPQRLCQNDLDNFGMGSAPEKYKSDSVKSWELGSKNQFFNNRLQIAGSLYYINWSNIQQNAYLPECGVQYTTNMGSAVSKGFDLQATLYPVDGLAIDSTLGFTDAHYTQNSYVGSNGTGLLARKGDSLGTPGWTYSLGVQYNIPKHIFSVAHGQVYVRTDYQYISRPNGTTIQRDPQTLVYNNGYYLTQSQNYLTLRVGAKFENNMNLSFYVNNLPNLSPMVTSSSQVNGSLLQQQSTMRPRYMGVLWTYSR